jgi:hypothetical protein
VIRVDELAEALHVATGRLTVAQVSLLWMLVLSYGADQAVAIPPRAGAMLG